MSLAVRALRGATTIERDEPTHLTERVQEMIQTLMVSNDISADDIISILFTATSDISSSFPASAARKLGLDDVALMGAQELDVEAMLPMCIRVLVHTYSPRSKSELRHVYLHGARVLRADLV
jgi:chorismate mutase